MGEQFINYQVRADSIAEVANVVRYLTRTKAYISPAQNRWIAVYDQIIL